MKVKEYTFRKTAKKAAEENHLVYINGNQMTDKKLLFDFSFLEALGILDDEMDAIKAETMRYCAPANKAAYVIYNADQWSVCSAVVDFNAHKVYNAKTGKLIYSVMEAHHIAYSHAERKNVYDEKYTENVRHFELDSNTGCRLDDYEV